MRQICIMAGTEIIRTQQLEQGCKHGRERKAGEERYVCLNNKARMS